MYLQFSYKQTPIGTLPEDWDVVRLENVSIFIRDGTHTPPKRVVEGIPLLSARNIANGRIVRFEDDTYITENEYQKIHSNYEIQKGDVLLTIVGTIGNTVIVNTDYKFTLQRSVAIIRPDGNKLNSHFLHFVFQSNNLKRQLLGYSKTTTQAGVYLKELNGLKLPLPPLPEQRRIAEVLGTVDSAIQRVGGAIEKTERLKRGLMQRLLTRGIGHERFKESEVGRVPEEWEVVRLGDALELCQYGLSVKMDEIGKYPIIKMDDIVNGVVVLDRVKYIDLDEKTFKNFKLEKGDILFNRTNSYELVGRTGIFLLRGDYVFASYLIRLRPKKEIVDSHFLTFYMVFSNKKIRQQLATRAVHQANINATNLQNFNIPLPPLPEQRRIAEILSAVDRRLELGRKRKEKLGRIKKGMMNDLLTGRKRVK